MDESMQGGNDKNEGNGLHHKTGHISMGSSPDISRRFFLHQDLYDNE